MCVFESTVINTATQVNSITTINNVHCLWLLTGTVYHMVNSSGRSRY